MLQTMRAQGRGSGAGVALILATTVWACSSVPPETVGSVEEGPAAPWRRTEERAPCASFEPLRQPLFGDLHIHTRFSADASIFGTKVGPRDAYAFARGASIGLVDDAEQLTRTARIDRVLDFAAVTDHAEFFGEVSLCLTPGSPLFDTEMCQNLRQPDEPDNRFLTVVQWLFPLGVPDPPRDHEFCATPGVDCAAESASVWQEMQAAAEEAYDRSEGCEFTSFIGYEHTSSPLGRHRHRNVIFRNHVVPAIAASQLETATEGFPQGLWNAIERDCLGAGQGCDAVIIPHNSNLSEGQQFEDPLDAADAQRRQDREPLVELHQIKGNSECRYDRLAGAGVGTEDELCAYEQMAVAHEGPDNLPVPDLAVWPRRNLVRNVLKDGLALEDTLGVNPFRMGFVGATDTHNATAGDTAEAGWDGAQGNSDASPGGRIQRELRTNPGGLTVVWAEENSRDAIFAALARRETYATSGTRPIVRLFAGRLDDVSCDAADLVARAYAAGTPMGGEIGPVRGAASPRFAVLAAADAGTAEAPGTALQRVQLVKGWVDESGAVHERVFDVAGSATDGLGLERDTCTPAPGARELCALWEDPEFDPGQRAFYYARVLENPSCRWSTLTCKAQGVDPFAAECAEQAAAQGAALADCCLTQDDDLSLAPVIQERAWTSPVWYRPDSIAEAAGAILWRGRSGQLDLRIVIARLPDVVAQGTVPLTLIVEGAGELMRLSWPAGDAPLERDAEGRSVLHVTADGIDRETLGEGDATLRLRLESGLYRAEHRRRWHAREGELVLDPG